MRTPGEIRIEWAIAHVIDHYRFQFPILSDYPLAFAKRPRLRKYFEGQVDNVLSDPQAMAARFLSPEDNPVAKACFEMLAARRRYTRHSQSLAKALFAAIGGNRSIASGNLVVLTYKAGNYPDDLFLALLKIDLTEVLIQEVKTDPKGLHTVTYNIYENALPTLGKKLQKAVVVRLTGNPVPDFEVLLLDKQVPLAADFFAKRFLNVEPIYDTRQRTERLYEALSRAHFRITTPAKEGIAPLVDLERGNEVMEQIRGLLTTREVDSPTFIEHLDIPDPAKRVFDKEVRRRLTEEHFAIDPDFAREKLIQKRRFVGSFGVDVRFDADFEDVVIRNMDREVREDGTEVKIVCLEVRELRWAK